MAANKATWTFNGHPTEFSKFETKLKSELCQFPFRHMKMEEGNNKLLFQEVNLVHFLTNPDAEAVIHPRPEPNLQPGEAFTMAARVEALKIEVEQHRSQTKFIETYRVELQTARERAKSILRALLDPTVKDLLDSSMIHDSYSNVTLYSIWEYFRRQYGDVMQPIVDQKKYADFFGCQFDQKSETFESFARNAAAAYRKLFHISEEEWKTPEEVEKFYRLWTISLTHRQVADKDGSKPFNQAAAKKWQELVQNAHITALATYTERSVQYRNAFAIWESQFAQASAGVVVKAAVEKTKPQMANFKKKPKNGKGGGGGRSGGDGQDSTDQRGERSDGRSDSGKSRDSGGREKAAQHHSSQAFNNAPYAEDSKGSRKKADAKAAKVYLLVMIDGKEVKLPMNAMNRGKSSADTRFQMDSGSMVNATNSTVALSPTSLKRYQEGERVGVLADGAHISAQGKGDCEDPNTNVTDVHVFPGLTANLLSTRAQTDSGNPHWVIFPPEGMYSHHVYVINDRTKLVTMAGDRDYMIDVLNAVPEEFKGLQCVLPKLPSLALDRV